MKRCLFPLASHQSWHTMKAAPNYAKRSLFYCWLSIWWILYTAYVITNAKSKPSVGQLCSSHGVDPLNQLIIATKAAPGSWQRENLLLSTDFKHIPCFTSDCRLTEIVVFLSCSPSPDPMEQTEEGAPRATICALALGRLQASTDSAQGSIKRVVHAGLELLNSECQWKLHDDVRWSSSMFVDCHWCSTLELEAAHCSTWIVRCHAVFRSSLLKFVPFIRQLFSALLSFICVFLSSSSSFLIASSSGVSSASNK